MNAFTKPSGNKPGILAKFSLSLAALGIIGAPLVGMTSAFAQGPDPGDSPSASQPAKPAASPTDEPANEPEAKPSESASASA